MRILFVIPAIGSVYGGPSKTVINLAQALHCKGVAVDIVTTNANGSESLDIPLRQWLTKSGYRIQYFAYMSLGDYKWSSALAHWLFIHVRDYDLVHSNAVFSLPNIPAHWACQYHHVNYLMTPHGMLEPWALSYKASKKRLYYSLLERLALNRATMIQALASSEADNIKALRLKPPIVVIPNGIHASEFQVLPDSEQFYQQFPHTSGKKIILFLGRIDPKKGLDLLSQAFGKIRHEFPDTHLVIAGPDNIGFLPTAKHFFAENSCLESVTFTGMLEGSLKYAALAAADIYVAPSYSEGFSVSILEGMAACLPCVITTGCNFPEASIAKIAHVVDINADAIEKALRCCLENPEDAIRMGQKAQQLIFKEYTWEKIAQNLINVYTDIIDQKPSPQHA